MFIIIAFYFCFLNHTKRFDIRAVATTIEANITENPTRKKIESQKKKKKNVGIEAKKMYANFEINSLRHLVRVCVCVRKSFMERLSFG